MEAETYLSSGFAIRAALEGSGSGWQRLEQLARIWQPARLKGIQVSPEFGTPFLAATQVFDARPVPRKWLALERTESAQERFVSPGTILLTCSGSVGRPTIAYQAHDRTLISHDILRVDPISPARQGWLYAFLRTTESRAMLEGAQYGHIIKHLEPLHVESIPVPLVDDSTASGFQDKFQRVLALRNESYRLTLEAEAVFERALGLPTVTDRGDRGFLVTATRAFAGGRRRFDASFHNPAGTVIRQHLSSRGNGMSKLSSAGYEVWLPSRFKRVPAKDGVWLLDSADLTEVSPDLSKRIADGDYGDPFRGRVEPGWILMARSGQTYGIIGTAILSGEDLRGHVISDHVMRIRPTDQAEFPPGYLLTVMSHPVLGRPLIKALAYGSSIPEIDVADVEAFEVVRLRVEDELAIASLAEASAKARAEADLSEQEMGREASVIVQNLMSKKTVNSRQGPVAA